MKFCKKLIATVLIVLLLFSSIPVFALAENTIESTEKEKTTIGEIGGYLEGALLSAKNLYTERNFLWAEGHGFAAETANNLNDRLHGRNATVVGGDNAKNGADRKIVNRDGSVVWIQDKYYSSATQSLNAAFENDLYKYIDGDGKPMVLEVPSDQYDDVVNKMRTKISEGKVPGVSDPNQATSLVKKGKYSYKQAVNLTKAGNIDSLIYDSKNGVITALPAMGLSFVLDYVSCVLNGVAPADALKNATLNALKTGGFVFATYVISSQLAKTGLASALAPATDAIAKSLGTNLSNALLQTFGVNSVGLNASQITARVSSLLQSQIIVQGVVIVALTIPDVLDLFSGRISAEQLLQNLTVTIVSAAGGLGGAVGGTALGNMIVPGAGGVIGGIAGGIAGALGANAVSEWAVKKFLKSDADKMYEIIQDEFQQLGEDFLLTQEEADKIVVVLQDKLDGDTLKDMYASEDRISFARTLMTPIFEKQVSQREKINVPSEIELRASMMKDMNGIVFLH